MNSRTHRAVLTIAALAVLALSAQAAQPAPAAKAKQDIEIPLAELKQVEAKKKARKTEKTAKKSKRRGEDSGESRKSASASSHTGSGASAVSASTQQVEGVKFIHEPFSYVVPGRNTTIKAVISSREPLKSVKCLYRASDTGKYEETELKKIDGTQFSYAAVVPGLPGESKELRYVFIALLEKGSEAKTSEYVTPLNATPVVPGWQSDPAAPPKQAEESAKPESGAAR